VKIVRDERLAMLKWHHLKVELDNQEKEWPEGSHYEFAYEEQTVIWFFGQQEPAPERLVLHLTHEDLWSAKPSDVADRIIRQANKVANGED